MAARSSQPRDVYDADSAQAAAHAHEIPLFHRRARLCYGDAACHCLVGIPVAPIPRLDVLIDFSKIIASERRAHDGAPARRAISMGQQARGRHYRRLCMKIVASRSRMKQQRIPADGDMTPFAAQRRRSQASSVSARWKLNHYDICHTAIAEEDIAADKIRSQTSHRP